jgi:hypothetical protein
VLHIFNQSTDSFSIYSLVTTMSVLSRPVKPFVKPRYDGDFKVMLSDRSIDFGFDPRPMLADIPIKTDSSVAASTSIQASKAAVWAESLLTMFSELNLAEALDLPPKAMPIAPLSLPVAEDGDVQPATAVTAAPAVPALRTPALAAADSSHRDTTDCDQPGQVFTTVSVHGWPLKINVIPRPKYATREVRSVKQQLGWSEPFYKHVRVSAGNTCLSLLTAGH